ncbi:SUR7 protein-like protein [Coleophoma cylindrospora]|uniref:SUR7 protein-like protein n=1 Tax=Coleophoma cylindrospora TaxID=1849047 RepID=A0A3D8S8E6_9HELO|nr:SUR7 protein-like protein [Coleophoma cylindrospora]
MGAGRFLCVALPFGLTVASLICILVAMLAGVTNKNLEMFTINTANLSISSSSLTNLASLVSRDNHYYNNALLESMARAATSGSSASSINITASDLGLADSYRVTLWNYCSVTGTNVTCTKPAFNWAATALNTSSISSLASSTTGLTVTLPTEVTTALKTFTTVEKWTEVVYIIAIVATAVELVLGFFAMCSRVGSCCTFLLSGFSTVAIIAASIMATILSSTVVGAVDTAAKAYGVHSSLNTQFLATTWLAVAFSLASGLFWMFTICCCASDHSSRKSAKPWGRDRNHEDAEKMIPVGAYQRVGGPDTTYAGQQHGIYNQQSGVHQGQYGVPMNNIKAQRSQQGYEPYSHTAI